MVPSLAALPGLTSLCAMPVHPPSDITLLCQDFLLMGEHKTAVCSYDAGSARHISSAILIFLHLKLFQHLPVATCLLHYVWNLGCLHLEVKTSQRPWHDTFRCFGKLFLGPVQVQCMNIRSSFDFNSVAAQNAMATITCLSDTLMSVFSNRARIQSQWPSNVKKETTTHTHRQEVNSKIFFKTHNVALHPISDEGKGEVDFGVDATRGRVLVLQVT